MTKIGNLYKTITGIHVAAYSEPFISSEGGIKSNGVVFIEKNKFLLVIKELKIKIPGVDKIICVLYNNKRYWTPERYIKRYSIPIQ